MRLERVGRCDLAQNCSFFSAIFPLIFRLCLAYLRHMSHKPLQVITRAVHQRVWSYDPGSNVEPHGLSSDFVRFRDQERFSRQRYHLYHPSGPNLALDRNLGERSHFFLASARTSFFVFQAHALSHRQSVISAPALYSRINPRSNVIMFFF